MAENHCGIGFGLSFEFFYGSDFRSTAGIRQNDIGIQPSGSQCLGSVSRTLLEGSRYIQLPYKDLLRLIIFIKRYFRSSRPRAAQLNLDKITGLKTEKIGTVLKETMPKN